MSKWGNVDRPFWRIGIYKSLGRVKAVEWAKRAQGSYRHDDRHLVTSVTGHRST